MVSIESIREQFDELGIEPTDEIISKCIDICINNGITDPVEFVEQWMAYSVSKLSGAEPTVAYLNEMEAHEYTGKTARKTAKVGSIIGAGAGIVASPRMDTKVAKITTYRNVDSVEQDVLEMYGCITPKTKKPATRLPQSSKNPSDGVRGGGGGSAFTTVTYSPLSTSSKKAADSDASSKAGQVVYTYGNAQLLKQINWLPSSSGSAGGGASAGDNATEGNLPAEESKQRIAANGRRTGAGGGGGNGSINISFQPEQYASEASKYMFDSSYDRVMFLGDRIYETGNAICRRLALEEAQARNHGTQNAAESEESGTTTQIGGGGDGNESSSVLVDGSTSVGGASTQAADSERDEEKDVTGANAWFDGVKVSTVEYPSSEPIRVLGRIVVESSSAAGGGTVPAGKNADKLAIVDYDEQTLMCTRLDLSRLTVPPGGWSLFPGQTVLLEGVNPRGTLFTVSKIHHERTLTLPRPPVGLERPLTMVIASAPFTDRDDLLYEKLSALLQYCSTDPPDVLLLTGPFADASCALYGDVAETYDVYFEKIIGTIMGSIGGQTEVCVVANHDDIVGSFVYPTHPYRVGSFYKNLHFLPDPCVFAVEGLEVGVTTVDVIKQLVDAECTVGAGGGDKIKRAYNHLFHQASFYPLNPPPEDVPLDVEMLNEFGRLNRVPNVMVCPSVLNRYVREINRCVCINPGFVDGHNADGSYARLIIHPPEGAPSSTGAGGGHSSSSSASTQPLHPLPASYVACQIIKT